MAKKKKFGAFNACVGFLTKGPTILEGHSNIK